MANQTVTNFLTLPVELVYRILDHQSDFTMLCSMRNATTTLNLYNDRIGNVGAQSLGDALPHNTALTTLHLGCNLIGNVGAQSLGDGLRHNTTLTTLDLRNNHIRDIGAQSLSVALRYNTVQ
ncbi:unnamed protein product [Adineta steineri]|uniref:Uncharacterized protein n=1 Tax=Adineta steineri TaxID=433720 RepID=A0A814MZI3_9BILA|nr:unnamed protein product [Adineta steineri]CAF4191864.1 unnamed protein product [Adineta steineri]